MWSSVLECRHWGCRTSDPTCGFLANTGLTVLPVVAGEFVRPGPAELAQMLRVWQVDDLMSLPPRPEHSAILKSCR